jgi:hypothetical protein
MTGVVQNAEFSRAIIAVQGLAFLRSPPSPLGDRISHRLADRRLHPCHERPIEFEIFSACRLEKPPNFLRISV